MVATPIGNLGDMSSRAIEVLKSADIIACEDAKHSLKLLQAFGIVKKKLVSLHAHNEFLRAVDLIQQILENGQSLAYISDAGTPGICDPGADLVREAHRCAVPVFTICGPSALSASLSATGFGHTTTLFVGFFPRTANERINALEKAKAVAPCTFVFYESPLRILDALRFLKSQLDEDTKICISREISKIFESHRVTSLASIQSLIVQEPIKGEYVVCVSMNEPENSRAALAQQQFALTLREVAARAIQEHSAGGNLKETARQLALKSGQFSARDVYQFALQILKEQRDEND